jgi:hypothetical protein
VFNIGEANHLPAYSSELGVPLAEGRHVRAIDRLLEIAAERRAADGIHHTSPIALRFVGGSEALISMMNNEPTMMIELIMVADSRGGYELLEGYENRLDGVRPHWGQYNTLDAASGGALYPDTWQRWAGVAKEFNASGVFDSPFTQRLGVGAGA